MDPVNDPIHVLLAEDDPGMRDLLGQILREAGYRVTTAEDGQLALAAFRREPPALLLTDLKMPRMGGMELLRRVSAEAPAVPVIVLTAFGTVDGAVEAMRLGAFDFLTKPLPDPEHLRQVVARALAASASTPASAAGRKEAGPVYADPAFARVLELVDAVAGRDTTVLLTGESGVGKEVVARAVHDRGERAAGPFVGINCAALPETLLESELFGHEKGAFTGATGRHPGLFEQAHGGTLLLDEVGEMHLGLQVKFLRVLETRRVVRLGGTREHRVDTRVVAATNRDLEAAVAAGAFRQDLFFRLNVFPIHIPPLRERPADVLPLARHFLRVLGTGPDRTPPTLSGEAEAALQAHRWPGNVRELMNAVERATILAGAGPIEPSHLGLSGDGAGAQGAGAGASGGGETLKEMERAAIIDALAAVGGNRKKAAKRLGIALRTLQYKIKSYGIK